MATKQLYLSYDRQLGQIFDELRAQRHIAKIDLAPLLNISRASVHRKLRGDTPFTVGEAYTLARVLDTTLQDILTLIETGALHDNSVRS